MRRPTFYGAALLVVLASAGAEAREGFVMIGNQAVPSALLGEGVAEDEAKPSKESTSGGKKTEAKSKAGKAEKPEGGATTDAMTTASIERDRTVNLVAREKKETVAAVAKPSKGGGKFHSIVAKYAATYGVPVSLAHAVISVESNYRADARGRAGEVGLMQIKPSTARGMGYTGSIKALYDPETNIRYGMKYLGMAHKLGGGSTCGTILKYNAGHGAKRMNPVSAAYCAKVKRQLGT